MDADIDEYANTAHKLVDFVIDSAIKRLSDEQLDREKAYESLKFDVSPENTIVYPDPPRTEDFQVANIKWLTIHEFTIEKGEQKITQFLQTWDYQDNWLYCVDYLGNKDLEFDKRYRYRVRWSVPTRRKPIPRATASVYFTFDVSKIKPKNYPVDVYYVFETNRLVHRPGMSRFREQWLKDIIESKVIMMKAIDF